MKVTPLNECAKFSIQKTCSANLNCVWKFNCQPNIPISSTGGLGGTLNANTPLSNQTKPKFGKID